MAGDQVEDIEACPGCGCEPEIKQFLVRTFADGSKKRCGYHCRCSAVVVDGMLVGNDPNEH